MVLNAQKLRVELGGDGVQMALGEMAWVGRDESGVVY